MLKTPVSGKYKYLKCFTTKLVYASTPTPCKILRFALLHYLLFN